MSAAEMAGSDGRGLKFIVRTFTETNRGGNESLAQRFGHVRDHKSGIDPSAEKRAERHFAFEAISYGLAQRDAHVLDQSVCVSVIDIKFRYVPVLPCGYLAVRGKHPMAWLQLVNVVEKRCRGK